MRRIFASLVTFIVLLCAAPAQAAIAFDAATQGGTTTGTSHTFSHTTSGSNRILFVQAHSTTDVITGCTYNGSAMTLVDKLDSGFGGVGYLFYLIAPATGANNVVCSASASEALYANAVSYTGAKQSAQPDATNKANDNDGDGAYALAVTTIADNAWTVLAFNNGASAAGNAAAGSTLRATNGSWGGFRLFDSGGAVTPAGSYTMNVDGLGVSSIIYGVMASFSPDTGGGGGATPCTLGLLGVGQC